MSERFYIPVHEAMHPQPELIDGLAKVQEAIDIMKAKNIHALIVDKRDETDDFGLLTVREIATQVIEPNRSVERTAVYEIMVKPALTVDVAMNVRYAIRLLSRYGESRAIVTDKGHAVGFITLGDMVLHYLDYEG